MALVFYFCHKLPRGFLIAFYAIQPDFPHRCLLNLFPPITFYSNHPTPFYPLSAVIQYPLLLKFPTLEINLISEPLSKG
jgi:hypothetical protein